MKRFLIYILAAMVLVIFAATEKILSQEVYYCKNSCMNGEPSGVTSKFQYDIYIDNVIYIFVKFPGAYGQNKIHFRHKKTGEPGPVAFVEIDPSSTWICYEMNIPQWGEYEITVTDADNNLIHKGSITMLEAKQ